MKKWYECIPMTIVHRGKVYHNDGKGRGAFMMKDKNDAVRYYRSKIREDITKALLVCDGTWWYVLERVDNE